MGLNGLVSLSHVTAIVSFRGSELAHSHGTGIPIRVLLFFVVHLLFFVVEAGEGGIFGALGRDADWLGQPSGACERCFGEFGQRAFFEIGGITRVIGFPCFAQGVEDTGFGDFGKEVGGCGGKPVPHVDLECGGQRIGVVDPLGVGVVFALDGVEAEGRAKRQERQKSVRGSGQTPVPKGLGCLGQALEPGGLLLAERLHGFGVGGFGQVRSGGVDLEATARTIEAEVEGELAENEGMDDSGQGDVRLLAEFSGDGSGFDGGQRLD